MKTFGKLVFPAIFFGVFLWAAPAVAGEKGVVSCSKLIRNYEVPKLSLGQN
ncbi:MAG: hypothetical protein Q8L00_08050 [Deltaproteobacteria bacterium]|nr:hypothetical protein [Deltaproteobacteria bacterium]